MTRRRKAIPIDDEESGSDSGDSEKLREDAAEEEEELSEEEEQLEAKILPDRDTRGKRIQSLIAEAADQDREFWGHETWAEEQEDEEWSTEDEAHYKDVIDSDFDETESEEEDAEVEIQKRLDMEERLAKNKQRSKSYKDPRKFHPSQHLRTAKGIRKTPSQPRKSGASRSTLPGHKRPEPPPPARPRADLAIEKRDRGGKRLLSQEDHLLIAAKTELDNTKHLNAMIDHENWKKAMREQKQSSSTWNGPMELLISWSSERLIEYEEQQKAKRAPQGISEEETYCREMLFFVDFDNPVNSSIPAMYRRPPQAKPRQRFCCIFPNRPAKYRDPMSGEFYSDTTAFRELRRRHQKESSSRLNSRLRSLDVKLKNVLHYLSTNELVPFSDVSKQTDHAEMEQLPADVEDVDHYVPSDIPHFSPATSDEESRRGMSSVDISVKSPFDLPSKEKRAKRQKRDPDIFLPSPKRAKHESSPHAPSSRSSPDLSTSAISRHSSLELADRDARRAARRAERRQSSLREMQGATFAQQDDARQSPPPVFPIRRQPLRIRSTPNTFYQQPGLSAYTVAGLFGDPYSAAAPYGSSMLLGSRSLPFLGAPGSMSPGMGGTLDGLNLFPLGGANYPPFSDGSFPPFFPPPDSTQDPYSVPLQAGSPFLPVTMPLLGHMRQGSSVTDWRGHDGRDGRGASPDTMMGSDENLISQSGDGRTINENLQEEGHTQRVCYLYPSRASAQDNSPLLPLIPDPSPPSHIPPKSPQPAASTLVSSVYCYPSPSNLFLSQPSGMPPPIQRLPIVGPSRLHGDTRPIDNSTPGLPLLFPPGITPWPPGPLMLPQQIPQPHAVVIRPAPPRGS